MPAISELLTGTGGTTVGAGCSWAGLAPLNKPVMPSSRQLIVSDGILYFSAADNQTPPCKPFKSVISNMDYFLDGSVSTLLEHCLGWNGHCHHKESDEETVQQEDAQPPTIDKKSNLHAVRPDKNGLASDADDSRRASPLHAECSQFAPSLERLRALIRVKGCDPNQMVAGAAPLHALLTCDHDPSVRLLPLVGLLLEAGASLQSVDSCGNTPLTCLHHLLRASQRGAARFREAAAIAQLMLSYSYAARRPAASLIEDDLVNPETDVAEDEEDEIMEDDRMEEDKCDNSWHDDDSGVELNDDGQREEDDEVSRCSVRSTSSLCDVNAMNSEERTLLSYSVAYLDDSAELTRVLVNHGGRVWPSPAPAGRPPSVPAITRDREQSAFTWFLRSAIVGRRDLGGAEATLACLCHVMGGDPARMKSHVLRVMLSEGRHPRVLGPLYRQLKLTMSPFWSEPQHLRYLAWKSVRKSLGPKRLNTGSHRLGLPSPLRRYLTLASHRPTAKAAGSRTTGQTTQPRAPAAEFPAAEEK